MRRSARPEPARPAPGRHGAGLLCAAWLALAPPASAADAPVAPPDAATFATQAASSDARQVAAWVIDQGDNQGLPFVIVDKAGGEVFVIDARGKLLGAAPALLGLARGDDSPPGIGDRKLATITPAERITPAGRFVAGLGDNLGGGEVLWVDYGAAISLHAVITTKPAEHRLARLATPSPSDNRISYGCINVPAAFFNTVVRPTFKASAGIVYVLPETRSIQSVFFTAPAAAAATTASAQKAASPGPGDRPSIDANRIARAGAD
ncbi:MAG: hypothetical protein JWN66_1233 [Sphingomonas bacterium]|uniref:L,D-transpeptidase n=1 Tax=Sphingomonas bacterium TaxID=1895847 RepID=UPI002610882C|nr:L,D-transpeptidase [Sphingomonas bacterium]MDB5704117.1 hypothetical protein [Sphingomonas bacterium]